MRDAITTAMEVAGMLSISIAVGIVTWAWLGFAMAGLTLLAVGAIEGRR